ncbi:Piso0_005500 [Millerozyma farinosa CBS 7064]|uniref:Piso0_005500 protein n=1 Tax=Pichia sorbitophila (strain ATCC MYA-4447 / BCRC 22081 / CBS 7064 / NBRC 10061 / NRRL Y-12695) TaxID=559304 RepID=G8Y253_PICSO|nr:Piso0_005500 [Millerozyma farinosa CBS 7064]
MIDMSNVTGIAEGKSLTAMGDKAHVDHPKEDDDVPLRYHERTGSNQTNNYSVLDFYEMDSPNPGTERQFGSTPKRTNEGPVSEGESSGDATDDELEHEVPVAPAIISNNIPSQHCPQNRDGTDVPLHFDSKLGLGSILGSEFDIYGFKKSSSYHGISREEYDKWFPEYHKYTQKSRKKWHLLMKNNGLSILENNIPKRFPPRSNKVKKMIRKGLPPEWRGTAWFFYAGGYEKLNKHIGVYEQIVRDTKNIQNKDTEVIERDLNRTFPDNKYFNDLLRLKPQTTEYGKNEGETHIIKALRRVLVAFAHYQPHIGYCQSLNFLAGLLLLFMEEEKAFWLLVILTERIIPNVHSADLEGVHTDQGVLMLCIKEYIPSLWSVIGRNYDGEALGEDAVISKLPPASLVTSSWFMSIFVTVLPVETALRVWDILWYEGSKTIFRISLTICKLCFENPEFQDIRSRSIGSSETEQIELYQFMQNYPKTLQDCDLLISSCYKKIGGYGFGSLSQDEINQCRHYISKQRSKLQNKQLLSANLSREERNSLISSSLPASNQEDYSDVYEFHKPIMSGVRWNRNLSTKMKRKFSKKN